MLFRQKRVREMEATEGMAGACASAGVVPVAGDTRTAAQSVASLALPAAAAVPCGTRAFAGIATVAGDARASVQSGIQRHTARLRVLRALLVAILLGAAGGHTTADVFDAPLTEATDSAFKSVCSHIAAYAVQKGDFTQTKHIAKLNRNLASSGTFIISHDDGILWQTLRPYPSTMVVTKSAIIQTTTSGKKTVTKSNNNATFESFSSIIGAVFRGDAELLAQHFAIYFEGSAENWTIGLIPNDSTMQAVAAKLVMQGGSTLTSVTLYEQSGDSVRYEFSKQTFADSLTATDKALFSE